MKKAIYWSKIIFAVLIFSFVLVINIIKYKEDKDLLGLITNLVALFLFIIPVLYNNINKIFVSVHKFLTFIINPQVNCVGEFSIDVTDMNFDEYSHLFLDKIEFEDARIDVIGNKAVFGHRYGNFELIYDEYYKNINLYFPLTMSYRDSKKNYLKKYFSLCDILINDFRNSSPIYEVRIDFVGFNPFHRLFIKRFEETEVDDFNLELTDRNCKIKIIENSIFISSSNRDRLYDVMKEYIAQIVVK